MEGKGVFFSFFSKNRNYPPWPNGYTQTLFSINLQLILILETPKDEVAVAPSSLLEHSRSNEGILKVNLVFVIVVVIAVLAFAVASVVHAFVESFCILCHPDRSWK